ncbi:hypothetical protein BpHYR1_032190 [Brachionus plicatilis]|uniref:Uncharacterized protein n=1 Tax=Brachionus plicatilis TaxID=10195 RepID=A0A3M7R8H9_BRAPC|nr:hypothetical protein BpHYR1_032190 [Brachionus plicatilis]
MDKMNSDNTRAYAGMKARTGVNMISAEKEKGEVGSVSRRGSEKSEGEVMNPAIDLSVSPEKKNAKNNIKIKPIVNEVVVRDSNDFERKIFASTPDTSLFMSNQLASSNQILNDSYDLQIENSNLKRSKNSILISTNFSTTKIDDDDDDTLNNTSDLEEH